MSSETSAAHDIRDPALLGQTLVVIGGSAGIGPATARHVRAEGAAVILTGRDPERLRTAAAAPRPRRPKRSAPPPSTPPTRRGCSGSSRSCPGRSTT
ncbi:SDR family NAD(P)-dependent oxidoreductase [Streptomyces sp. NTH33]|uniref:SDR family NAD(P)-dependent oxidoreductase n=1 Tax=Streptomyces sp. NTH33 TaxID=1735453 RepID=UPI0021ACA560|nr:SDR family NAD(P)-dependent oxidoreductase [Streptomyces sp. NTH33]